MSASRDTPDETTDEDEWRFSVDEVGDEPADGDETEQTEGGNVAGSLADEGPLEPESISLENAVFFLVGALGTVLFIVLAITGL
jgi:hypothetical protein